MAFLAYRAEIAGAQEDRQFVALAGRVQRVQQLEAREAQIAFDDGNILLGGGGSDLIEGRGGDDVIDAATVGL